MNLKAYLIQKVVLGSTPFHKRRGLAGLVILWLLLLGVSVVFNLSGAEPGRAGSGGFLLVANKGDRATMFQTKDTNHDGKMSLEEYLYRFPDEAEGRRRLSMKIGSNLPAFVRSWKPLSVVP